MFSEKLKQYADQKFEYRRKILPFGEEIREKLEECTEDEALLMKFFYGTMPLRDAGEYDFSIFLSFVRHGIKLRKEVPWCASLPEDFFLNHVLYYRINSEDIVPCRNFFYEKIKDRLKGKTAEEAVIAVNYWCAENMTYQSSDLRTINPLTAYFSGSGRCGEESVFTVTALRSVGIAARQVYTPWWAHCDDNHAWVEVYIDGKWQYLGACEPEEVLNRGWFTHAAGRAMLIHSRNFSDYILETKEEAIGKDGSVSLFNSTYLYAKTKKICLRVRDGKEREAGAEVRLKIPNSAEFAEIARGITNEKGIYTISVGFGDLLIEASKNGKRTETLLRAEEKEAELDLSSTCDFPKEEGKTEFLFRAPEDRQVSDVMITKERKKRGKEKLKRAKEIREQRITSYFDEKIAEKFPEESELLRLSGGNFKEAIRFLSEDGYKNGKRLFHTLSLKDMKDLKADILFDHLTENREDREEIMIDYMMAPRIYFEELTPYRSFIFRYFSKEERDEFISNPYKIKEYISENIDYHPALDYTTIYSTPIGLLKLKSGNEMSRKILFVAICRSFGIPARLNEVTLEEEYYKDGTFHRLRKDRSEEGEAYLKLKVTDGTKWHYNENYSLAFLEDGEYRTLHLHKEAFRGNELSLSLRPGTYRLIVSSRMPNGNQFISVRNFKADAGETTFFTLSLKEAELKDMLVENEIADFEVKDVNGTNESLSALLAEGSALLAFLEEGTEPTEHVLNELIGKAKKEASSSVRIIFLLGGKEALNNETLKKAIEKNKNISVYFDENLENAEPTARRMYAVPDKLPLLLAVKQGMKGIYASAGYNVGSVDLIMKLLS